jgi:hypothetical protein
MLQTDWHLVLERTGFAANPLTVLCYRVTANYSKKLETFRVPQIEQILNCSHIILGNNIETIHVLET